jgi:DNA invertase Pin-like site-specific DNA recombinase
MVNQMGEIIVVTETGTPHEGEYVLYFRVSTEKQGKDGLGIEAQEEACRRHLNGGTWKVIETFKEVESGRNPRRPELQKALCLCEKTGATLLVARLDRLARNMAFVSTLMESSIKFECADMPFANNLTIHIVAAMAQHYSDSVSVATSAALQALKSKGRELGSKNIKQVAEKGRERKTDISLEHAEMVYPTIERIRSFGITTLRGIAQELTDRKIETAARWRKQTRPRPKPTYGDPVWGPQQVALVIKKVEEK